jgi:hypothetical protein
MLMIGDTVHDMAPAAEEPRLAAAHGARAREALLAEQPLAGASDVEGLRRPQAEHA